MEKEQLRAAKAQLVAQIQNDTPGKERRRQPEYVSLNQQLIDYAGLYGSEVKLPCKMDGMATPASCVERCEPFLKNSVAKLLRHRVPPFR